MLKLFKRAVSVLLCGAVALSLCSCSVFDSDIDSLLVPPSPSGELGEIKAVLDDYNSARSVDYKHPTEGEFLSPIITKDIDSDGTDEAFAFFSSNENEQITMHLAFISKRDGEWAVRGDCTVSASNVANITFADLDADGALEAVTGWSMYGGTGKQVTVHDLSGDTLVQRLNEECNFFLIADLNKDSIENLYTSYLSLAENTAVAKVFSIDNTGVSELGSCSLDANVASYSTPIVASLADGRPAVYIDAVKGNGMITEVVYFEDGQLKNGFIDSLTLSNNATYREGLTPVYDFDADGIPEIPLVTALPSSHTEPEPSYVTRWCSFDGQNLFVKATAVMNYTDGYYALIPDKLKNAQFTITRRSDMRLRIISLWDAEKSLPADELLRIKAVAASEWDEKDAPHGDYYEVTRNSDTVIAVMISSYAGDAALTVNEVKKMIGFIK